MEALDDMEEPRPVQGAMSVDPMAEAWLRELAPPGRAGARRYGTCKTEVIEEVASKKLGQPRRDNCPRKFGSSPLFGAGKLGQSPRRGCHRMGAPRPAWLKGKF